MTLHQFVEALSDCMNRKLNNYDFSLVPNVSIKLICAIEKAVPHGMANEYPGSDEYDTEITLSIFLTMSELSKVKKSQKVYSVSVLTTDKLIKFNVNPSLKGDIDKLIAEWSNELGFNNRTDIGDGKVFKDMVDDCINSIMQQN